MSQHNILGLFRHQRTLFKYYSLSREVATQKKAKNGGNMLFFFPNIPVTELKKEKNTVEKWKTIVFDGLLYCTSPRYFNDPFDSVLPSMPDVVPSKEDREKIIVELTFINLKKEEKDRLLYADDFYGSLQKIMSNKSIPQVLITDLVELIIKENPWYRELITVSSFSESKDSILMWAHYANNFTGVCLEYNFDNPLYAHFSKGIGKVIYSNKRPQKNIHDSNWDYARKVMFSKANCWEYEKEWRFVSYCHYRLAIEEIYPTIDVKPCIKAIYLGSRIDPYIAQEIIEYYKESDVNVYEMIISKDQYKIDFNRVI